LSVAVSRGSRSSSFTCTIIIPEPRTDVKFDSKYATSVSELRSSQLTGCVYSAILQASEAAYVRGQQQQRQEESDNRNNNNRECITIQRNTAIIVCSNNKKEETTSHDDDIKSIVDRAIEQWKIASVNLREENNGHNNSRRQRE
jgi:hypothetical protein